MDSISQQYRGTVVARSPSLAMRVAAWRLRRQGKALAPQRLPRLREKLLSRSYPAAASLPPALSRLCEISETVVCGHRVITLVPRTRTTGTRVIYMHGGCYVNTLVGAHWSLIKALIQRTGAAFTVPLYPLAPEYQHQAAHALIDEVYREMCLKVGAGNIVLMGDSAGGGLALAHALHCRDSGLDLPRRVVLFAPWLDITMSNPEAAELEEDDLMLGIEAMKFCGELWAGQEDQRRPHLSPIFGTLSDLPPIDIYQGTADVLLADARRLFIKGLEARAQIRLFEYIGAFHVFMAATFTRESRDVIRRVAESIAGKRTGG